MTEYIRKPDDELATLLMICEEFDKLKGEEGSLERIVQYIIQRYDITI